MTFPLPANRTILSRHFVRVPTKTTAAGVEPGIDLLDSLQLYNTSRPGVSSTLGSIEGRRAYYLQGALEVPALTREIRGDYRSLMFFNLRSEFLTTDPEVPGLIPSASRLFYEAVDLGGDKIQPREDR
uniref:Uncharacterized protein n=1 Tax=Timema monikensis TaxID=170555 RepID=A0A7R9E0T4_9NEOP|nr:unnamed protein product [Timema monikensis]